jgi:hypothetical protein
MEFDPAASLSGNPLSDLSSHWRRITDFPPFALCPESQYRLTTPNAVDEQRHC